MTDIVVHLRDPELVECCFHVHPCGCRRTALAAAAEIERLRDHVNVMCGWAELLAEEEGWTRDNAASFWTSWDLARAAALRLVSQP